jgi:ribosomal protein L36
MAVYTPTRPSLLNDQVHQPNMLMYNIVPKTEASVTARKENCKLILYGKSTPSTCAKMSANPNRCVTCKVLKRKSNKFGMYLRS